MDSDARGSIRVAWGESVEDTSAAVSPLPARPTGRPRPPLDDPPFSVPSGLAGPPRPMVFPRRGGTGSCHPPQGSRWRRAALERKTEGRAAAEPRSSQRRACCGHPSRARTPTRGPSDLRVGVPAAADRRAWAPCRAGREWARSRPFRPTPRAPRGGEPGGPDAVSARSRCRHARDHLGPVGGMWGNIPVKCERRLYEISYSCKYYTT